MDFIGSSVRSVGFICIMGSLPWFRGQIQSKSLMLKLSRRGWDFFQFTELSKEKLLFQPAGIEL